MRVYKSGPFVLRHHVSSLADTWLVTVSGKGVCRGTLNECVEFIKYQTIRLNFKNSPLKMIDGGLNK